MARTRWWLPAIALAAALTACAGDGREAVESKAPPLGPRPPGLYTVGKILVGLPGRGRVQLESAPVAPLAGWLTPAAVPSPDRRVVAYNAWTELRADDPQLSWEDQGIEQGDPLAWPSIRVYDSTDESDQVLEEGAFSLAWRGDGALAYFKGTERDYRAGVPYTGHVVVRPKLTEPPQVWTLESGRYIVAAWAGQHLLVYREQEGEALDLLVLDGPGRVRVLAPGSALVAVSPDGRQAFVEQGPARGRPSVSLLEVASGRKEAELDLTTVDPAVGAVGYSGDWSSDLVVAESTGGLAVFRVAAGRIELQRSIRLGDLAGDASEPRFADSGATRIVAWSGSGSGGVFLDCDRSAARCEKSVPVPEARGIRSWPVWRRPVYNPSRPQEGER